MVGKKWQLNKFYIISLVSDSCRYPIPDIYTKKNLERLKKVIQLKSSDKNQILDNIPSSVHKGNKHIITSNLHLIITYEQMSSITQCNEMQYKKRIKSWSSIL